ncbi:MAG: hypothetical protein K6A44_08075 [bacterium]|nr:hypothetical protein [bacterium]
MNKSEQAISLFNEEKFDEAEQLALEMFEADSQSVNAVDILAAIYLRTNNLNFLKNINKSRLDLIRKLAVFLTDLQTYEQAAFFYEKAIEIDKNDIIGLNNLALMYEQLDNLDKAKLVYEKSIRVKENYPALYNLGVLARKQKNISLSKICLKKALNFEPENPYANYSLGMTYLMEKDFEKGYPYFLKRPVRNADGLKNFWDGKAYKDKTILVFCEYGLGDGIMFSRYFPFLKDYFANVKVCCNAALHSVFRASFEGIEFVNSIETDYDYCVFSMNLPCFLKMDFSQIPFADGYLKADEEKVAQYKEKYFDTNNKKIGIFYIGGELEKRNAKYRRITLRELAKLFDIPSAKFYSFQKDDVLNELAEFPQLVDLGKTFGDFSDTAAAMKNLDILITIDSAPVHLSGALGIKTFLMLPYFSEWRWFLDESQTLWYNSVELFRQQTPCEWQGVVDKIYDKLV